MLLTDDRLVDTMREFVTANNRLELLRSRPDSDPRVLESVERAQRLAGDALRDALVERGWRQGGT